MYNATNMDAKLTIKLDQTVITRAKNYAADRKISLSRLIEGYLDSLTEETEDDLEISPFVKSISTGKSIPNEVDAREEYFEVLEQKYK